MTSSTFSRTPRIVLTAILCCLSWAPLSHAAAVKTEVVQRDGKWQLLRDGKPYFIKGVGGDGPKPLLAELGGNSVRTWGADNLDAQLDEAQKLGLSVTVGIWLGQERSGFSYNNADQVAEQLERCRQAILKYKDHPAVLMWGIGNEMEGYKNGDNAAIWSAVNNIASMAHKIDPNHPTMTVIAEIGGDRVKNIHRLCPDIDVVGINSYAGMASIPKRYKDAGGTKPYVITEFGPPGTWEVGKNSFGALVEPTSTAKGDFYRQSYESGVASQPGLCLGSYAFLWGNKEEATATWFGMLLPDNTRLAPVEVMGELWSGKQPANHCPKIEPIEVHGGDVVSPGQNATASVKVTDADGDPVKLTWQLHHEQEKRGVGGDREDPTREYPEAIVSAANDRVQLRMPAEPGVYRLYVVARDGKGNGATANTPLMVRGQGNTGDSATVAGTAPEGAAPAGAAPAADKPDAGKAPAVKLPFVIYGDGAPASGYIPSGWMGNTNAIAMNEKCTTSPHTGDTCIKAEYKAGDQFGGVVWQDPANDWGDKPGGKNLTGAKALTFWARGENGGEKIEFKFGVLGADKKFHDSASGSTTVTLGKEWKQYSIDLKGKDLSQIKTAFCWVLAGQGSPVTFYLDDIQYE